MDLAPRGDTTWAEQLVAPPMPSSTSASGLEPSARAKALPGGVESASGFQGHHREFTRGLQAPPPPVVRHRYHPVKPGLHAELPSCIPVRGKTILRGNGAGNAVALGMAGSEAAGDAPGSGDRAAPLTDHLDDHVLHVNDIAAVPFLFDAVTEIPVHTAIGIGTATPFQPLPGRPANTPVTAHELSPRGART